MMLRLGELKKGWEKGVRHSLNSYSGTQLATLIVFDGDEYALETTQQGMVLVGVSPAHLDLNVGSIVLY